MRENGTLKRVLLMYDEVIRRIDAKQGFYGQLRQFAKGSRIWGHQLDLRHENEVRSFCEELKSKGLTLGIIDTSDVPNASETGTSAAAQYVTLISQYAPDSAIFLNTAPAGGGGVRWS